MVAAGVADDGQGVVVVMYCKHITTLSVMVSSFVQKFKIIADDVKCSHGASINDLEEDQLFNFQARRIDLQTARKALIVSFGAQGIDRFPSNFLQKKVELHVKELLDPALPS